jgi:hypothetical protein
MVIMPFLHISVRERMISRLSVSEVCCGLRLVKPGIEILGGSGRRLTSVKTSTCTVQLRWCRLLTFHVVCVSDPANRAVVARCLASLSHLLQDLYFPHHLRPHLHCHIEAHLHLLHFLHFFRKQCLAVSRGQSKVRQVDSDDNSQGSRRGNRML